MPRSLPRRFRLHLSTALLLSLIAGVLMFVQTIPVAGDPDTELLDENWRYLSDVLPDQSSSNKRMLKLVNHEKVEIDSQDALIMFRESASHGGYKVDCYGWPFHAIMIGKFCAVPRFYLGASLCLRRIERHHHYRICMVGDRVLDRRARR